MIDRVMVALPRELDHAQRLELLRAYAEAVTQGRASWLAAVHGDRPANPHAHFLFRDRDAVTGKRVMMTTERGSTQRLRQAWEHQVNAALARAGLDARVDARSLAAQGIDRVPEVHRGPRPRPVSATPQEPPQDEVAATTPPAPAAPSVVATAARPSLFRSLFGAAARLVTGRLASASMLLRPQLAVRARRRDGLHPN